MSLDPASQIEPLLKLAGERDLPSAEGTERARAAALDAWRRLVAAGPADSGTRPRRWWVPVFVAAAGVAAVLLVSTWWRSPPPATVAHVSFVSGDARIADSPAGLVTSAALRSGDLLVTGDGKVALRVGDALSLRLGSDSRLRFEAAGQVTLLQGSVYVDSGGLNAGTALRIDTPAGTVRHVGTQFQVQVHASRTRVQVREGRVVLSGEGRVDLDLAAGDLAEVSGVEVRLEHGLPSFGTAWEWAAMPGAGFDIENRPMSEFLAWLAREHGWQLRYTGEATPARVQGIRLHGSMQGLDAPGMLERVSLITGLPVSVREGVVWIGDATSP